MSKDPKSEDLNAVFEDQEELDLSSIPEEYAFQEGDAIEKENSRKQRRHTIFGVLFILFQAVASAILLYELIHLDLLPNKFLIVIGIVLLILLLFTVLSQTARNGRVVGRVYASVLAVVFIIGSFYLWKTSKTLDKVTDNQVTGIISDVRIVVLNDSPIQYLQDLADKTIGIQTVLDRENTDQTLKNLSEKLGKSLTTTEFTNYPEAAAALFDKSVDAIIINKAFSDAFIVDQYPDFENQVRVVESFTYTKPVEESSKPQDESSKTDETKEEKTIYHLYFAGNDAYGQISTTSGRSDVNILATINTKTHTVILTNTPRDYYVQLTNGGYDKLAHAAILGINESMAVLENLYDIKIDYYVRVNFSGFEDIVNALGGVDVYTDYEFTTVSGYHFEKGYNTVYGDAALAFVRERKAFGIGDIQRGRNQMAMIKAMMNKILSPSILASYLPLLDSLSGCFATNMPKEVISTIVKNQLNDNAQWTVITQNVDGEGNMRPTYTGGGQPLSVLDPDYDSVNEAIDRIQKVIKGEYVEQPTYEEVWIIHGGSSSGGGSSDGSTDSTTDESGSEQQETPQESNGDGGNDGGQQEDGGDGGDAGGNEGGDGGNDGGDATGDTGGETGGDTGGDTGGEE